MRRKESLVTTLAFLFLVALIAGPTAASTKSRGKSGAPTGTKSKAPDDSDSDSVVIDHSDSDSTDQSDSDSSGRSDQSDSDSTQRSGVADTNCIRPKNGKTFKVKIGDMLCFGDTVVRVHMITDGRCPEGMTNCVWDGNVKVQLYEIVTGKQRARMFEANSTKQPEMCTIGDSSLKIVDLDPRRKSVKDRIPPGKYKVTMSSSSAITK